MNTKPKQSQFTIEFLRTIFKEVPEKITLEFWTYNTATKKLKYKGKA